MKLSLDGGFAQKPETHSLHESEVDNSEDEDTVRISREANPALNRETTDPGQRVATFALAESGIAADATVLETHIKTVDAAMEAKLLEDAIGVVKGKIEAGRDPNELLEMTIAELQSVEDEVEDLTEGHQATMLKDAEARKAKLAAQVRWIQSHLDQIETA
jgi:hypothetical protein